MKPGKKLAPEAKGVVRPLDNRIVVDVEKIDTSYEIREGLSFYLPPSVEESRTTCNGTVIAVGTGEFNEKTGERRPPSINIGQRVMYGKYAGTEIIIDGVDCRILNFADVIGLLDDENSSTEEDFSKELASEDSSQD